MCPACLTTLALAALGSTGAGAAVTAFVLRRRSDEAPKNDDHTPEDHHEHERTHRHA